MLGSGKFNNLPQPKHTQAHRDAHTHTPKAQSLALRSSWPVENRQLGKRAIVKQCYGCYVRSVQWKGEAQQREWSVTWVLAACSPGFRTEIILELSFERLSSGIK